MVQNKNELLATYMLDFKLAIIRFRVDKSITFGLVRPPGFEKIRFLQDRLGLKPQIIICRTYRDLECHSSPDRISS